MKRSTPKISPAKNGQIAAKTLPSDLFTKICRTEIGTTVYKEHVFHPVRKWRFDYALPEHMIAVEVEGGVWTSGRHTRPQGFINDMEKYNAATVMGWRVLRVTPDDLLRTSTLNLIRSCMESKKF